MKPVSRIHDGIMLIAQDNAQRTLRIVEMNAALLGALGYAEPVYDAPLFEFLGAKTRQLLEEDIEYEDDAYDIFQVLSKQREIRVLHKDGSEIPAACRITREMAQGRSQLFRLLVSPQEPDTEHSLAHILKQAFTGHEVLDAVTRMADPRSMQKYIGLTQHFTNGKQIDSCFIYMEFESGRERDRSLALLRHVGQIIRRNLRTDDTVGMAADNALGIILVDVNRETVHLALSRIRQMIGHDPMEMEDGTLIMPHVRQACVLLGDHHADEVIAHCASLLEKDPVRDMIVSC